MTKEESSNKKITENKKEKPKKKRFHNLIALIVIICVIGVIWFILSPNVVTASTKAQLVIESGTVQVKHAGGSWILAENGMELYESDSIKTGENTSASIILFKSSIIRLDSKTEITLKEIIQNEEKNSITIQQDAGRTWNTVSKISGIDNYEVQTPTTVASVRGTSFGVTFHEDGNVTVGIGNGTVNITRTKDGESINASENESVTVEPNETEQPLLINPLEFDEWVQENMQKDQELRQNLKQELYSKIEPYIPELKQNYGISDQEIDALLEGYLSGYWNIPPDTPEHIREILDLS